MVLSLTPGTSSCNYQWWFSSQLHHQAFSIIIWAASLAPQWIHEIWKIYGKWKDQQPSSQKVWKWGSRDGCDPCRSTEVLSNMNSRDSKSEQKVFRKWSSHARKWNPSSWIPESVLQGCPWHYFLSYKIYHVRATLNVDQYQEQRSGG